MTYPYCTSVTIHIHGYLIAGPPFGSKASTGSLIRLPRLFNINFMLSSDCKGDESSRHS